MTVHRDSIGESLMGRLKKYFYKKKVYNSELPKYKYIIKEGQEPSTLSVMTVRQSVHTRHRLACVS